MSNEIDRPPASSKYCSADEKQWISLEWPSHWCLLPLSVGSLWKDKSLHVSLSLLLVHPGIKQFFGITLATVTNKHNPAEDSTLHSQTISKLPSSLSTKFWSTLTNQHKLQQTITLSSQFKCIDSCYNSPAYMIPAFCTVQQPLVACTPAPSFLVLHARLWEYSKKRALLTTLAIMT